MIIFNKYKKGSIAWKLVDEVNQNPDIFISSSIQEVSKKIFIGVSTISRTVRKMGFRDYKDFKFFLVLKRSKNQNIKHLEQFDSIAQIIENTKKSNEMLAQETIGVIDLEAYEKVSELLITSTDINFFGIGYSSYMCEQMCKYFGFFNLKCNYIKSFYDAIKILSFDNCQDNSVWVIVSKTLKTKEIRFIIELVKKRNIDIVLITSNNLDEIYKNETYKILFKSIYEDDATFSFYSKISLLVITNILIETVIYKLKKDKKEISSNFDSLTDEWKKFVLKRQR